MIDPSEPSINLRLPPERFYWAVLDTSIVNSRGLYMRRGQTKRMEPQWRYLLEPFLPVPLEEVHAVFHRLDQKYILACGMERRALETFPAGAISLGPSHLPAFINRSNVYAEQINLLTGPCTPRVVRGLRASIVRRVGAAAVVLAILLVIGLERRTASLGAEADAIEEAMSRLYDEVLGPVPAGSTSGAMQPRDVQFVAELRRLQQTRGVDHAPWRGLFDLSGDLESLLRRWPNQVHLQTETIALTSSSVTVRANVPTEEVQAALEGLSPWGSWRREQPEVTNQAQHSTVTVRFVRAQEGESE